MLLALVLAAGIPAHAWSFGAGVYLSSKLGDDVMAAKPDLALALEGTYEGANFFGGLELMAGQLAQSAPKFRAAFLRFGATVELPLSPFIAFGFGPMHQEYGAPGTYGSTEIGFTGELGVLLFRDHEWGRGSISLIGIAPVALDTPLVPEVVPRPQSSLAPMVLFGARLML